MTPSGKFGFLLLWYLSHHGIAIKHTQAMVTHTAACRDTFVNAVSKWSTLSQVAQLPYCRLQLDTASQQHNLHCPHLHSTCSPHLLHLKHWQPRWTSLQPFLPHQLFKEMPLCQCLWHPMPHLCSHKDLAVPAWHPDAWSRKSKNSQPGLSTDLVIVMCHHLHPQSLLELNCSVSYSQKGGCCIIIYSSTNLDSIQQACPLHIFCQSLLKAFVLRWSSLS